jgi:hypothetical protein
MRLAMEALGERMIERENQIATLKGQTGALSGVIKEN